MRALAEAGANAAPRSEAEVEQEQRDKAVRALAKEKRFEELDAVKRLRALAAQAVAFTLRDRQLEEQAARRAAERAYEGRMDGAMEAASRETRRRFEAEEEARVLRQQQTREVLAAQIKARERQRLIEEEAREQEGQRMRALVERQRDEEQALRRQKVEEARRLREEVLAAHGQALEARREAKMQEREVRGVWGGLGGWELRAWGSVFIYDGV
jgi:hypothetical protein